MKIPYHKQDKDELFETIIRWSLEENEDDEVEVDIGDALHVYFDKAGPRHWCEVRDEARLFAARLYEPEDFEEGSPIDSLLTATAAQAADGVWQTVAEAFGLNKEYVEFVMAHWHEREQGEPIPEPAISWEEFMRRYETEKAEWEADKTAFASGELMDVLLKEFLESKEK
jgi:hypothetical protein